MGDVALSVLVHEFATCVAAQTECIAAGNSLAGNQLARRYIDAFAKLRSHGTAGREALSRLLEDPRPDVRVMAAAFLLRHSGPKAIAILESEAKGGGPIAFGAAQALQRWREGTWSLDPPDPANV